MTDNSQSWFDNNPRITLAVVIFSIIFLLILVGEGLARHYFPQWAPMTSERARFWEFDSKLGWRHIPNQVAQFNHPDFSVEVSINSQGLRDREYSLKRTEKKRMLVLGDSYGWGFGVENDEVFTELMEEKHPDWEIINASVSGYGTVQEYLYYRDIGYQYQADVVLLLFYDNDFDDNIGKTDYWYSKPIVDEGNVGFIINENSLEAPSLKTNLDVYFLGNFYLIRILYGMIQIPVENFLSILDFKENIKDESVIAIDKLKATEFVLSELIKEVNKNGSRIAVVKVPLSEEKNQLIQVICDAKEKSCFHLNKIFRKGKNQAWRFKHDRHWNVLGHQLAADSIDQFLLKEGMW